MTREFKDPGNFDATRGLLSWEMNETKKNKN